MKEEDFIERKEKKLFLPLSVKAGYGKPAG